MRAAAEALRLAQSSSPPHLGPETISIENTASIPDIDNDSTYNATMTAGTNSVTSMSAGPKSILKKKGRPKLTNKERKERGAEIERIVSSLPLEFRGNDPNLRRHIEIVIEGFLDREGRGVTRMFILFVWCLWSRSDMAVPEFVKPPDLNQARVNKCLIALVNRKIVRKDNSTVRPSQCDVSDCV